MCNFYYDFNWISIELIVWMAFPMWRHHTKNKLIKNLKKLKLKLKKLNLNQFKNKKIVIICVCALTLFNCKSTSNIFKKSV